MSVDSPHLVIQAKCAACGHHWVAVAPEGVDPHALECQECKAYAGRPATPEELLKVYTDARGVSALDLILTYEECFNQLWGFLVMVKLGVVSAEKLKELPDEMAKVIAAGLGQDPDEWMEQSIAHAKALLAEEGINV